MIVCVCKAVSERDVRRTVRDGRACDVPSLMGVTGAGTCCGSCVCDLRRLVDEETGISAERPSQARPLAAK